MSVTLREVKAAASALGVAVETAPGWISLTTPNGKRFACGRGYIEERPARGADARQVAYGRLMDVLRRGLVEHRR